MLGHAATEVSTATGGWLAIASSHAYHLLRDALYALLTSLLARKQPRDGIVPRVPCTGIFLGPSKSGKTVALISAILEQYRTADGSSVFERIYIFSPSMEIDDGWRPVKKFIENEMGVNTEWEQGGTQNDKSSSRRR